ncbi:MAG TPA: hypothetical protein VL068_01425 [Microthrixaceae bacterium]|nr:hypothetical protein [Microthrixaceae bacterium]
MSIEIILIPVGIAAYAAWKERNSQKDASEETEQTAAADHFELMRVTSPDLLRQTLEAIGATNVTEQAQNLMAEFNGRFFQFQTVDGHILGTVRDASAAETMAVISKLDATAGRITQDLKSEEIRLRAAQLGLELVGEEVDENGTVQLIFEEVG